MKVAELMSKIVRTCRPGDSLSNVAREMWDGDCGCMPVIDTEGRPIAMITDRDIAMAAFLTGERLDRIPVRTAQSQVLHVVHDDDSIEAATTTMQRNRVRRLPVIDATGKLVGLLSSADLVRQAERTPKNGISPARVTWTLAGISEPWNPSLARVVQLPPPRA